ncbi:aspartate aminotransferase family protein [Legionella israelensis]|uniref:Acetylornithine aminotransferase n=1 Tax=Legionella israelensis TaxID=454 RepID=A0A0W0V293_9GAMM|nr:aspartate aminotransferase family protein [Legionella israelensis]KTD14013.1 ornithine/acetylornithine aminotransferase [Legionella israelensis]QBS09672.1 aspartate aminotransferase family protein [Legionella israelensis]SCY03847.1 acetylornithine aminotransferase [Legionella israelensis DSM 19235]STX60604.1 ornithine/acetylornithine aminotransferase [Legionella israelensis]
MALITSYNPMPITFSHGEGVWLYDEKGKAYFDGLTGIAVCGLGHAHPDVTRTIQEQAAKLLHTSNAFHIREQEKLAEKLTTMSGMEQVFFANSGAEANEAAIKLTRLYGHQKNIETPSIIVMERAFHGRTMATLTASGSRKVQAGFEPLVPGFIRAPFNDLEAIKTIATHREDVVAVMLETIQGEAGIYPADESYLRELAKLCEEHDWMLIFDEIQTGNARTGKLYSCMKYGIQPDVLTTAKGLGNGMPIGACLMSKRACNLFQPGNHGSTFGGNPLACATAMTVLEVIEREHICEKVNANASLLKEKIRTHLEGNPAVKEVRGKGYMLGIELDRSAMDIRPLALANGILFNVTAEKVIRLLPPLIMDENEMDELVKRLTKTIHQFTE